MQGPQALLQDLAVVGPLAVLVLVILGWRGRLGQRALAAGPGRVASLTGWDILAGLGLAILGIAACGAVAGAMGLEMPGTAGGGVQKTGSGSAHFTRGYALFAAANALISMGLPSGYWLLRLSRPMGGPGLLAGGALPRRPIREFGAGLLGLVAILPIFAAVGTLTALVGHAIGDPPPEVGHALLREMQHNPDPLVFAALAVTAILIAPITEELVFRGLLQSVLLRYLGRGRRWLVIIVAAGAFASIHLAVEWQAIPGLFVLGLALGYLYERTASPLAPIVLHLGFNGLSILYVMTALQ